MSEETKIHITMKVNRGEVTEKFTGWLNSGSTTAPEKALSLVGTPTFPDYLEKNMTKTEVQDSNYGDHWRIETVMSKDDWNTTKGIVMNDYKGKYFAKGQPENPHFKIPKVVNK